MQGPKTGGRREQGVWLGTKRRLFPRGSHHVLLALANAPADSGVAAEIAETGKTPAGNAGAPHHLLPAGRTWSLRRIFSPQAAVNKQARRIAQRRNDAGPVGGEATLRYLRVRTGRFYSTTFVSG